MEVLGMGRLVGRLGQGKQVMEVLGMGRPVGRLGQIIYLLLSTS